MKLRIVLNLVSLEITLSVPSGKRHFLWRDLEKYLVIIQNLKKY